MNIDSDSIKPQSIKFNHTSPETTEKIKEIINQLIKKDIIRECNEQTKHCNNIYTRKKQNSDDIEIIFDHTAINEKEPEYPREEIIKVVSAEIKGKSYVSIISLENTSYSIPLTKNAQILTAFWANGQKYCFKKCPEGLEQQQQYLTSLIDNAISELSEQGEISFFKNELLITTDGNIMEHFVFLCNILKKLKHIGLKIKPQRMTIAKKEFTFANIKMNVYESRETKMNENTLEETSNSIQKTQNKQ